MNEKLTAHDEMEIIESIIYTFQGCAVNDLWSYRFNSGHMPGILLIQVLDGLSGFLFTGTPRERVDQFVASYLPKYAKLPVYDTLTNSLHYNYVVATTNATCLSDGERNGAPIGAYEELPVSEIIEDLDEALQLSFEDLRNDPGKRQVALERYQTHKVYYWACSVYSQDQRQKLRDYYLPLVKANSLIAEHAGGVYLHFSPRRDKNYLITVIIEDYPVATKDVEVPLDLIIAWMGLRKVEEVLA